MNTKRFSSYLLLALLLLATGSKAQHQPYRDSLRQLVATTQSDTTRIKALSKLTEEYLDTSYSRAMAAANTANSLAEKTNWLPGKILAQTAIGYCYQGIEMPDSALHYFRAAYTLALGEPNKIYVKKCLFALSRFYSDGNPDSSLHYKYELRQCAQQLNDTVLEIYCDNELAGFYYGQKDGKREAIRLWHQVIALLQRTPRRNHEALIWGNIGTAYLELGMHDSARHNFLTAHTLAIATADENAQSATYLLLAGYFDTVRHLDSAKLYGETALKLARTNGNVESLRDVYDQLAVIYQHAGKPAQALEAYKQFIVLRDSVTHEARNATDAKNILRATYAQELSGIHWQQEAFKATNRSQSHMLLAAVIGLLLVGFLAIVYYYALVQNRKRMHTITAQAVLLREQKQSIETALADKEMLMREIHHRVKNNLQVISALLQLQGKRSSEASVKSALEESQNRLLSIAFIHQNLYQHDDLSGVEMQSFLAELVQHLSSMYQHPGQHITIQQQVKVTALNIDVAVPLGLIINELLTNSFKYAFAGREQGNITILLSAGAAQDTCVLDYRDDGPGLPPQLDMKTSKTLGLTLINDLCRQLGGKPQYPMGAGFNLQLVFDYSAN